MIEAVSPEEVTLDYVAAMQGDVYSIPAEEILPYLADVEFPPGVPADEEEASHTRPTARVPNEDLEQARDFLLLWDRRMERESAGAVVFALFYQNLVENLFTDEIPEDLWTGSSRITEGSRVQSAVHSLLSEPRNPWWDDVETPERRETRDDIIRRAFAEGLIEGIGIFDAPVSEWRWAEIHTAEFRNQTLGESGIGIIEDLFNRGPVAVDGGLEQVLSADWDLAEPYEVSHLSSMRQIIDLADLGASRMMHTTGQSGHPFHRHYDDMIEPWADVRYHDHLFSRKAVEDAAAQRLVLEPAP
jgi:penicillin amidase